MTDAPNAPAPASVADTKHAIGCAEDRGVSCDCGATNAMLARLDHLRAAKQAPAAAPPASPPTAEERAEWRERATQEVRLGPLMIGLYAGRVLRLLDALAGAERERDDQRAAHARTCGLLMVAERAEPLDDATPLVRGAVEWLMQFASTGGPSGARIAVVLDAYAAALRELRRLRRYARHRYSCATQFCDPCDCGLGDGPVLGESAEEAAADAAMQVEIDQPRPPATPAPTPEPHAPSADAASEVKALVEFYVDAAVRLACLRGGRALDEQETKHARCRDQVRAAIDALAARAPTVTAALEGCSECHNRHGKPTLVCSFCARAWSPQPAAMAEPCGHLYAPEDPTDLPCVLSVGHVGDHCDQTGMKWGVEPAATAEPPAVALGAEDPTGRCWAQVRELRAEVAFYAGRTLEAEADAVDWKLKAEAAVSEVAALRADRDRLLMELGRKVDPRFTVSEPTDIRDVLAAARQPDATGPDASHEDRG